MKTALFLTLLVSFISSTYADWNLATGHYVPAKMTMTLVHPRPDSETVSAARHRLAYPDGAAEYRIPVAVQGGAYPFRYELVQGPSGMTVGEYWDEADYGIVSWTPSSAGGPYTVEVLVTDQEGNTVTATWTVTATTNGFIFLDPNAGDGGDGTKASPFNEFADIHLGSDSDATYAGDIVYIRGGTITLSGPSANGNLTLNGNKPNIWLGYTGETAIVDFGSSKYLIDGVDDVFIGGFDATNARTDVNNAHFFFFSASVQDRATVFEMDFSDIARGTSGLDNPGAVTFFNPGAMRQYFTMWGNEINDTNSPILDLYAAEYFVVENNVIGTAKTTGLGQGMLVKCDDRIGSIRRNTSIEQTFQYGAVELLGCIQSSSFDKIEIAYNKIDSGNRAIVYNWSGGSGNYDYWIYRNTVKGDIGGLDSYAYTVTVENNIVIDGAIGTSGTNNTVISTDNLVGASGDGILDGNYELTAGYSAYLGTHGAQLDASGEVTSPDPVFLPFIIQ